MIDVDVYNQLVPNILTMSVQLLSTLVLFLIARYFLWDSVKAWLAKRSEKMQEDLAAGEKARTEAENDRMMAREQLTEASDKAETIVSAAVKQAKDEKSAILAQAESEAKAARKKAQEQIEAERQSMYQDMQREMVEVALAAAGKLLEDRNAEDFDRQAIDAFVKEATGHD